MSIFAWVPLVARKVFQIAHPYLLLCLSVYSLIYLGKCDKVTVIKVDESV